MAKAMCIPFSLYCFFNAVGFALAFFLSPWFLLVNAYIVPVLRFHCWASFSLLLADFTFGTEEGVLHVAGGPILYLLMAPAVAFEYISDSARRRR